MDILISVAAKIAEFTVEPIGRQVGYLLCYRNNLKELKDQVEELQTTKERIDLEVRAEERNGREIQRDVIRWRQGVIKSLEEVEKLCKDEPHASVRCWKWSFPNLKSRHQLGRKAKKMTNTIVEMKKNGNFDKGVGYAQQLDITNNFLSTRGIAELQSRNSIKEDVVLSVKDPKVSKIGVYGIGGVGKSTLAKQVAKQVKDDKLFDAVVMVTISQTNLERIQDEIAEQLGLYTLKEMTSLIGRANCLCERIKKEKTILIILDDLQEKIDLDKLGIPSLDTWGKMNPEKVGVPLKDDYKGCKLLMTSRSQDILQKNDAQKNFSLHVLNDEESWSLFEAMVGDIKDDNFRKIATQVAQRCAGLPVLIITIAKSLKYNKDIYYWKDTLNNLKRVDNSRDMNETLVSALEFSFNRLEDQVKKVFLLCGVYGTSIPVSDLLKYAIGLGIFRCINTIEDARNRLYRIIIDLKASCFLVDEDARSEMLKMHDIIHEVAVSMASKYAFTKSNSKLEDWPRKDILERCTHIILHRCCIQKLPERLDCPHLTFLYMNSFDNRTLEIPNSFFEGAGNLEALDLTGLIMYSLPPSLRSLTKLKTFCLDYCSLKDMIGIGALKNLEILSLIHSSMEEFPTEIVQLTKLRMLDLRSSGIRNVLPNILCKLTKIEELYMGNATINWAEESSTTRKGNASLAKLGDLTGLTTLEIQIREAWLLPKDIPFEKLERYKVVIGDKWEWSDNLETSRLLKVKLDTNFHGERGIKRLIKGVEDLYLDKISGISNVVFELNGEGFPLLRYLHIQNNGEIQHIVNSMERNQTHVVFPELETMILHNLNNLVTLCHGSVRDNSFGKLKVVKVRSCDQLVSLFSISMVKAFFQLVEIEVSECTSMKNIMSVESTDSGNTIDEKNEFLPLCSLTLQQLPTIEYFCSHELSSSQGTMENLLMGDVAAPFFSAKVKFSNLETLKLSSVNLKKIWDDSSAPYLVHNLANLTVENCSGLKYLFSSSMVRKLSNLKQLEISKCDMMEQIIATEEINVVAEGEILFPKLEAIMIKDMQNLKTIWHPILASNSLTCLKTLKVKNCEKIEKIFPEYMKGAFAPLETLKVKDCKSLQEIFQIDDDADDKPQLKYITLLQVPQLKQIWSRDSQSSHCFKSLQVVRVEDCGRLEYLFPFSMAGHLPQLEAITIKNAEKMKEIVSKREEPLDNVVNFEFDQLTSIVLWRLQNLQGFYDGNHRLSCSSLKRLDVVNCEKLKLFKTQSASGRPRRRIDNNLHFSIQQPLFTFEEVIDNIEKLSLNNKEASMIVQSQIPRDQFRKINFLRMYELEDATCLYWFLRNTFSLQWLIIEDSYFQVIFLDKMAQDENGEIEVKTRLNTLMLNRLYGLQHICKEGCQLDPVLEVLEYLIVLECSNLKHLVPSSVTFNHLTYLLLQNCMGLIYLITSSTATSLVKLTTLKIRECDSVEQIVAEAGGESILEIVFKSLLVLELESLPKLQMFCSSCICCLKLPVLERLVIRQCARMESFSVSDTSTPLLREIVTDEQDKKWFCEGDLNNTVNKMFQDKVAFRGVKHLELFEYPELKELWSSHVEMGIFGNLTNLVVHKCDFLSDVLLPLNLLQALPNLEELRVRECDSLRSVFDLTNLNEREMPAKVIAHLKTIELSHLRELKHIWKINCQEEDDDEGDIQHEQPAPFRQLGFRDMCNIDDTTKLRLPKMKQIWGRDSESSLRFKSLQVVRVEDCEDLEYLFPFFIAKQLPQLEEVIIKNAEKMKEIVFKREEPLDNPVKFEFHQLISMVLWNLQDLRRFCAGNHSLSCSSLKHLDVSNCQKLKLCKIQCASGQGRIFDSNLHFLLEELADDLEKFSLNNKDEITSVLSEIRRDQFHKLNFMRLSELKDATSLYWFLYNISNFEWLVIQDSSFEMIFLDQMPQDENGEIELKTRLKELTLRRLYGLQHICKEGCQLDPVLEVLECLYVVECSSLKHLVPSTVTFNHLTYLEVRNCNGLIYLITFSTATSLVKLTTLKIGHCDSVEEIVAEKGGENITEIAFNSLEVLELDSLSKLQMFCSSNCLLKLPVLEKLVIRQCPRMTSFSAREANAPLLQKVLTGERNGIWCWEGDLTRTVNKMFQDMVAFSSFNYLEFSKYPELKKIWYGQFGQKIFRNLKHLVVRKCTFLSNVIFSSNLMPLLYTLEELEVAECDSLEAIFDVKALDDEVMESKEVSGLEKLILSGLPNLKRIWNREAGEIISFENLQIVKIDKCQQLKNLFSVLLCQDLRQLEELCIESCGVKEIVSIEEGLEELKFDFPQLTALKLFNLKQLTNFYPKKCTLVCSSLKILDVHGCEELQIFAFDYLNSQSLREDDIELQTKQALFCIEEVCQDLEELPLNEKDCMEILNRNYEKKLFQSIKLVRLQHFQETPMKFLNEYVQIFPAMTTLEARYSSFETLFPLEEIFRCNVESPAQIKTLLLCQLEQLKHIWSDDDDSASYPLVQNLENLSIVECPGIIRLVPPSASFKNLTSLQVKDCNGLIYFMTSCTAKSLIHLTSLAVSNCGMLEEVVMTDEGEAEEEITFESLEYLKLTCLSGFKSFCSGKHSFIFPSLVKFKVKGCPMIQHFSSGVIIAPFLKSVRVENGRKRWKDDLNTTIKQIFIDKANEGVEGDCKESSSINIDNNQTHQKTVITSRALSSDESKANKIVDSGKQAIHKLPTPHTGIGTQEICEITETLDQASQNTIKLTKVDAAFGTQDETIQRHLVQATHQGTLSPSIILRECTPDGSQDMQLHPREDLLVQATTSIKNDDEDNTGAKEMHETIQGLSVQNAEDILIPVSVQDIATEIHVTHESIHKPIVQATQNAWDITIAQKKEESSHDSDIHLSKNLFHQTITSVALDPDYKGTIGTRDMYEFKGRFLVHDAPNISSPNMLYDTETNEATEKPLIQTTQKAHSSATTQDRESQGIHDAIQTDQDTERLATTRGTQKMCDTIKKTSILAAQNVSIISTMTPNAATVYQSLSQAPELGAAQNTEESYNPYIETQEKWDNVKKPLSPTAQNIRNSPMILDAEAIDQSPSKAPKPMTSSILESSAYSDKWLIDISKQNLLPYLDAGLKRHPQVLDWFNTKRRRAFAALFSEVTCILRTTRRCDLTEDDRNYIRECCAALEAVGFDASWLSYVSGCIESCGDGDELMIKLEEAEAKASNLRNELASVEASIVSLRDEASRLHHFIEE